MVRVLGYFLLVALVVALSLFSADLAFAETRVALVIGNSAYRKVPVLPNSINDANDVAAALKRLGFDTILATDQDKGGMEEAEIRFARAAKTADVAMFYYSGHAMQFAGLNYLAPVDASVPKDEADLKRMIRVDDLVADLQQARNLRILVLDSCRDNPLADGLKRTIRGISAERGLAKIDTPEGMIVAYSTQAGHVAFDDEGDNSRNSPYTKALLKEIEAPDEIETIFRQVSRDVYDATHRQQLPELSLSLTDNFYLHGRLQPALTSEDLAPRDFEAAKGVDTVVAWDAFLKQHPNGFYATLAKENRAKAEAKLAAALPAASAEKPQNTPKPASVWDKVPLPDPSRWQAH